MGMAISGNVVTPERAFYGTVAVAGGKIDAVREEGALRPDADWVLPGFIDLHLHGLGDGNVSSLELMRKMAEFGPSTGLTGFLPTRSASPRNAENSFPAWDAWRTVSRLREWPA